MKISENISQLIDNLGISQSKFAGMFNLSRQVASNIMSGKNSPKIELLQSILLKYKNLNARWLLTGEGEMWRDEPQTAQAADARPPMPVTYKEADTEGNIVHEPAHGPEHYRMVIETQRKTIEAYERLLSMYDSHNAGNAQKAG